MYINVIWVQIQTGLYRFQKVPFGDAINLELVAKIWQAFQTGTNANSLWVGLCLRNNVGGEALVGITQPKGESTEHRGRSYK